MIEIKIAPEYKKKRIRLSPRAIETLRHIAERPQSFLSLCELLAPSINHNTKDSKPKRVSGFVGHYIRSLKRQGFIAGDDKRHIYYITWRGVLLLLSLSDGNIGTLRKSIETYIDILNRYHSTIQEMEKLSRLLEDANKVIADYGTSYSAEVYNTFVNIINNEKKLYSRSPSSPSPSPLPVTSSVTIHSDQSNNGLDNGLDVTK